MDSGEWRWLDPCSSVFIRGLRIAIGALISLILALPAGAMSVDPSNRYYRDAAGNPKFLIGYYGWAATPDGYYIDHPSRYSVMITQGAPYEINYIRMSACVNRFTSTTNPPVWSGNPTPVPFLYVSGKADLNQWDPVFWNGLKAQCQLARDNGVIVHVAIFDGVEIRQQGGAAYGYANSFWNPSNQTTAFYSNPDFNGNGQIDDGGEFYQLTAFNNNTGIGYYQKRLIDKVTSELAGYDNVFYEVGNELLGSDSAWNTAVISYIRSKTAKPVSQCAGSRATNLQGWSQHSADTPAQVKANVASIVGFGYPAWEDCDGPALSDPNVSPDDLRRAAWYSFVGGSPCWGGFTVDFWIGGRGFWVPTVTYYRNLQTFIETSGVRFWETTPQHSLVGNNSENSCLAKSGSEYLVYVLNDSSVTLNLSGAIGTAYYRTYDPKTAVLSGQQTVTAGGTVTFNKPAGADDWVVHVTSTPSLGWDTLGTQQTIGSGQMPAVTTDSLGNIHVVYLSGNSVQYKKYDPSMNLLATETVASSASYWPHIMCDSNNVPHVVYTESVDPGMPYARYCYYTNRIGGSWKTPVTAISLPSGESIWYPRLGLWGSYAYIGCQYGNASGSIGKIVRLTNLSTTPSVDRSVNTATRSCIAIDPAGQLFAPGRNGGAGTYCQQYDSSLNPVGGFYSISAGAGKTGGSQTAWADQNNVVHMVAWAIEANGSYPCNDRCGMVYNNTGRRNPDGSYPNCVQGLLTGAAGTGPDGNEPSGWWNDDVAPVIAVDALNTVYVAWRGWTPIGEGRIAKVDNSGFTQICNTDPTCGGNTCTGTQFCSSITRRRWWNCEIAPAAGHGVYAVWEYNGTVYLRPIGVQSAESSTPTLRPKPAAQPLIIDGNPNDWNLSEFTTIAHAGTGETGDIALTGYDNGRLYYAGYCTTAVLPTSAADHTAKVYSRYDSTYQYFLVRCDDSDVRYPNGIDMNWANDCVEIYIDPSHDGGSSAMSSSTSDIQLVIDASNQKNVYMCTPAYTSQVLAGVTSAVTRDATGWWLEVRITKSALDPDIPATGIFGVDFNFRDNDNNNDLAQTTVYTWADNLSGAGFPSKIPDKWGQASPVVTTCLSDPFAYADGSLNGNGGWGGSAASQIAVENQTVKISGGAGAVDAVQTLSCGSLGGNQVGVWAKIKKGTGSTIFWNLWIDDPSGRNFGRWFGAGTTVRGKIGTGSQQTASQSLTGNWDCIYVKIDFAANTTQFFFNGTSLGTYGHVETAAGDALGRIRFERLDSSGATGQYVYFDDVRVALPDAMAPTPTVGQPSLSITRTCDVSYTVTFDEPVFGFNSPSDVQVNATGSAAGSVAVTGSGPYTVSLSGITGAGTLGITVKASSCVDAAGNGCNASPASATFIVIGSDGSIAAAKQLGSGAQVDLGNKVVYLKWPGLGYIEEANRTCGVRLEGSLSGSEGDLVCLRGTVQTTAGGERYVQVTAMSPCGTFALKPLGCNNRGIRQSLMNGLYVRTWSQVKPGSVGSSWFYITDGSDDTGIKVITNGPPGVSGGGFVNVSGAAGYDGARVIYRK